MDFQSLLSDEQLNKQVYAELQKRGITTSEPAELANIIFEKLSGQYSIGYSDYWRRNKSTLEPIELANALRALRKVVGYVGANVKRVEWSGMSHAGPRSIFIDPTPALGTYPIPPGKMDVLVGMATHEAFHCKEWSDWVLMKVGEAHKKLTPRYKVYLEKLVEVGEDIYVNNVAKKGVLGLYIDKMRAWYKSKEKPWDQIDFAISLNPDILFQIWRIRMLDGYLPSKFHSDYQEPLNLLLSCTPEIIENSKYSTSVSERSNYRSELYLRLWEDLSKVFKEWEQKEIRRIISSPRKGEPSRIYEGYPTEEALSPQLAQEVAEALATSAEDVTALVEAALGKPEPKALRTVFKDATEPFKILPDPAQMNRLRRIFYQHWERTLKVNRGLDSGKVDGRKLYRVPITDRVFKRREHPLENIWGIAVLLDASTSMGMAGTDWQLAQKTCAALYKTLEGYKHRLEIYAYHEDHDICRIYRMFHDGGLFTVNPQGRTPSAQAIIIAGTKMPRGKRNLLIHVTDGECNCGVDTKDALAFCERNKIELITLGFGYENELLKEQYGKNILLLESFEQLPQALAALLKRKLLGG